jgi:hypothetical protein
MVEPSPKGRKVPRVGAFGVCVSVANALATRRLAPTAPPRARFPLSRLAVADDFTFRTLISWPPLLPPPPSPGLAPKLATRLTAARPSFPMIV